MKSALVWVFVLLLVALALIAARGARRESWPMVCSAAALGALAVVAIRYLLVK